MAKIKILESQKRAEVHISVNLIEDEGLELVKDKKPAKVIKFKKKK